MYSLKIYIIKDCYFCNELKNLLKSKKIKSKIKIVKEENKHLYKNENIKTFPMVYMIKKKHKILLGGYDDLNFIINKISNKIKLKDMIKIIKKKYHTLEKKEILRLIELLNH